MQWVAKVNLINKRKWWWCLDIIAVYERTLRGPYKLSCYCYFFAHKHIHVER